MYEPFPNDPERQRLRAGERFVTIAAVGQHAGQLRNFRDPPAIVFTLNLDDECHHGSPQLKADS
jgi:hypothetical protein